MSDSVTLWTVAGQAPLWDPQARTLEWGAISYSKGPSQPRDQPGLLHWWVDSLPLSHLGSPGKIPGSIKIQGEAVDCKQCPGEGDALSG